MNNAVPDLVYPGRKVYHAVYGSHDGGYDPQERRWEYWVLCDGGPKKNGWPKPIPKFGLATVTEAEQHGLRPCSRSCAHALKRLKAKL